MMDSLPNRQEHATYKKAREPLAVPQVRLAKGSLAPTQGVSQGVFWLLIAVTLLLMLGEVGARFTAPPMPFSVGWVGAFVLYYALRSASISPGHPLKGDSQGHMGWRLWRRASRLVPLGYLGDVLVMSLLVALTGGWASPVYLLYLGWAMTLLDEPSPAHRLVFSGLAALLFLGGVVVAAWGRLSPVQAMLTAEHVVVVLLALLGSGGIKEYLERRERAWSAERRHREQVHQVVLLHLSHELYTPLSAISTSASLLTSQAARCGNAASAPAQLSGEGQRQLARLIERNCARMTVLLDDLLAMWRDQQQQLAYQPARLACLPLAEAVSQTIWTLLAAKQQHVRITVEPSDVSVLADPHRLEQILVNLLANAHKYSPAGMTITLTISAQPDEAAQPDEVLFAVQDEGPGVPLEEQAALFELGYRGSGTLTAARGGGIGLALAKALVVSQGGRIWVESAPARGSRFCFTLPRLA